MRQRDQFNPQTCQDRFQRPVGDHAVKASFEDQFIQVRFLPEDRILPAEKIFIHHKKARSLCINPRLLQTPPDSVCQDLLMYDQHFSHAVRNIVSIGSVGQFFKNNLHQGFPAGNTIFPGSSVFFFQPDSCSRPGRRNDQVFFSLSYVFQSLYVCSCSAADDLIKALVPESAF